VWSSKDPQHIVGELRMQITLTPDSGHLNVKVSCLKMYERNDTNDNPMIEVERTLGTRQSGGNQFNASIPGASWATQCTDHG